MRLVTVCGPPSSGKTSVIIKMLQTLAARSGRTGVVKFDCIATDDDVSYRRAGFPVLKGLSGPLCPDHFFVSNIEDAAAWAEREKIELLVSESAGLCSRCAPHLEGVLAVCVIDNLSGVATPRKIGPMLKLADIVVITKGDIVSQAEREVFAAKVSAVNASAAVLHVNGLSGQGAFELGSLVLEPQRAGIQMGATELQGRRLRFTMPAALCSYCLGETRLGDDHQRGNVRKLKTA